MTSNTDSCGFRISEKNCSFTFARSTCAAHTRGVFCEVHLGSIPLPVCGWGVPTTCAAGMHVGTYEGHLLRPRIQPP